MVESGRKTALPQPPAEIATYEERLAADPRWALSEGSLFFEGKGAVQESLRRIATRLNELGISYAVAGGMALFQHGYRRFTEDVDILVTRDGLKAIHKALDGRGYVRPFERSKNLKDAQHGVKIEFLIAGDYPGDGKPKPVTFPEPQAVAIERDGIRYLKLPALVELKLASGLTGSDRMKDLADVQELIKLLNLPEKLSAELNESVREEYGRLWRDVRRRGKRYLRLWRRTFPGEVRSLEDMIKVLRATDQLDASREFVAMRLDGVTMEPADRMAEGYFYLVTTDPEVAKKYGMEDEAEFWNEDED